MPRQPRIDYPGAIHHVTNRGRNKQNLYGDDADRELFLEHLASAVREFEVQVLAFALMGNHYHVLVRSLEGRLSDAMQLLAGRYTQDVNSKYGQDGALFKGRFFSKLIEDEAYLLEAARYVPNNPVKAGIVDRAEDYRWSSYASTLGIAPVPDFLTPLTIVDDYFGGSRSSFDAFVRARDTHTTALFEHVTEAWGPDQLLSEAIGSLEEAIERMTSFSLRSATLAPARDLLIDYVGDAFGISVCELAKPRSESEKQARLMLLALFHRHRISTIDKLASAFGFSHKSAAHRCIRRFEGHATADPKLASTLDRGLRLLAQAA